jgi:chemotaxis signal transduction protein
MTRAQPAHASHRDDGILCCEVGDARYAFRSRDVRHVERAEYMRLDRGADGRFGTLRLGAQHVPVFALGELLAARGASSVDSHDGHIAVTGDRQALTGWLVDRIARAAEPGHGDIAPLPPIVGAPATSWFEGVVWIGEDESALLLAPARLTGEAAATAYSDGGVVFDQPRPAIGADPEPVAVVFSTAVLPASAIRRFALSGRQIAAIVPPTPPIPVPGCSDHVSGVTWWRRSVVPVIDFRPAADRSAGAHRRRLIAQCGGRQQGSLVAFSIDSEIVMCRPGADHRLLPDVPCPPFASGVFDVNGEAVALLNLDALLDHDSRG